MLRIRLNKSETELLHFFLSGFGVAIAAALTGVVVSPIWSLATILHGIAGAAIVALAATIAKASTPDTPSSGGAPPAAMLFLGALVGGGMLAMGCSTPPANAGIIVRGPAYYAGVMNPGDTLAYSLSTTAVPGATGYRWTVTATATNGTWTGLLAGATSTGPSIAFTPSAPAWDSVTFSVTVVGTSATRSSKAQSTPTTWRVYRYLPAPLAVTVDSSHVGPISLMIRSPGDSLAANGSSIARVAIGGQTQFCATVKFGSGHVAPTDTNRTCLALYTATYSAPRRVLSAAESAWLSGACSPWSSCLGLGALRAPADALMTHRA